MKITHVIRGDDHLSNTPKQVALYEALGWPVPEFAHLSTILGADRERLSKRHGATSIANFRDMGVLPEALVNYLALLGWAPSGGTREIFSSQELIKESSPERIEKLALAYYTRAIGQELASQHGGGVTTDYPWPPDIVNWLGTITRMLVPSVDRLEQLPDRASLIFHYDAKAALASSDNTEVLGWPNTDAVLARFTVKILEDESAGEGKLTPEQFKKIVNEVKAETGAKGKELFHPIRIVVTGSHSGPEFDKLVPILEEGSRLPLPKHVLGVRERVEEFGKAR